MDKKIRPALTIYHPAKRGDGSAFSMSVVPAGAETGNHQGWMEISIAKQSNKGTAYTFPRFDWAACKTFKLDIADIGEVLMVFSGAQEGINGWKGIKSFTADGAVFFQMRHTIEPAQGGYLFEITTNKGGVTDTRSFQMTRAEAAAVVCAIEGALPRIAFGE